MTLKELLKESFGLKDNEYIDEQSIFSLEQFDSMNHMVFITKMEDEFKIELTGDEIVDLITISDIKRLLQAKGVNKF